MATQGRNHLRVNKDDQKIWTGEFQAHISSGRIHYRADPFTPNVWQHKDAQDWEGEAHVARSQKWQEGHEKEPEEEEGQWVSQLYQQEAMGLGAENIAGKGFGKGQSSGKGKGKGGQLALEDGSPEDEEPMKRMK